MYKLFLLALATFIFSSITAQKLNTKDFEVQAQFIQLPAKGLDPTISTYQVKVDGIESDLNYYGQNFQSIKDQIRLDGYQKVEGGASLIITVNIGTPTASAPTLVTEDKPSDAGPYKVYSYKMDLGITSSVQLTTADGRLIENKPVVDSEVHKTTSYKSQEELKESYKSNYPKAKNDALRSLLTRNINNISNVLNYDYGLTPRTVKASFESLSTKDHPDLAKYDKMKTTTIQAFSKMTAADNSAFLEAIKPVMEFWIAEEKKYDPNNKDEKKMNFALRQNIAIAYIWAEDWENAKAYATKIEQGDVNANFGKRMKEDIADLQAGLKRLNRTSRHFTNQLSAEELAKTSKFTSEMDSLYAAGDIKAFPGFETKLGVLSTSRVEPATMYYKGGKKESGYIVYESNYKVPDFRRPLNVRFGSALNKEISVVTLDYDKIDSIRIDKNSYHIKDITVASGALGVKINNAIIEPIRQYKKTTLVIVHPPSEKGSGLLAAEDLEPFLAFYHKGKAQYMAPDGLGGYRKALTNALEDCPAVGTYLMAKSTPPSAKDDRIKRFLEGDDYAEALRIYDTCK